MIEPSNADLAAILRQEAKALGFAAAEDLELAARRLEANEAMRQAFEETQSLLTAMLLERRPESEIEKQIGDNRAVLDAAREV